MADQDDVRNEISSKIGSVAPKQFFEDAYHRRVLRQSAVVYQFRHARLRDHLARRYRA